MFELAGAPDAETKQVLARELGFSCFVPGHPRVTAPERDHFTIHLDDADVTLLYRVDRLDSTLEPKALAESLVTAYMTAATAEPGRVGPAPRPPGASAAVSTTYPRRVDDATMEYVTVVVKATNDGIDALYQIVRFRRAELNAVQWANLRTAISASQNWSGAVPPLSSVWPASTFAKPGVRLELLTEAWAEARSKADALATIAPEHVDELTDILIQFAVSNDPPSYALHRMVLDMGARQIAMRAPADIAEVLLRNFFSIETTHDLRAWCWQCLWALGNRAR